VNVLLVFTRKSTADMFWYFTSMTTFTVVILVSVSQCTADIQELRASWMARKTVPTSYLTLERYSKIRCAEKCYAEGKQGKCKIAAFNKATKTCRLSMDSHPDAVDISDDSSGVYILPQGILDEVLQCPCQLCSIF